jgi:gluconolactonase
MTLTTSTTPPAFSIQRAEFADVLGCSPRLVKVADIDAHEGPVYAPDEDALYFTTAPRPDAVRGHRFPEVAIKRLILDDDRFPLNGEREAIVRAQSNAANGMTLGVDGFLLACEQGTWSEPGRISRVNRTTGEAETVVDQWGGLPFNSPNDVVVKRDGTIWFTDPSYGYLQGFRPQRMATDRVYRHDPLTGATTAVSEEFDKPNGLAFSPDESVLYIGDSGANHEPGTYEASRPHHILAFDVSVDGRLTDGRLFAVTTPGFPDGLKVDNRGRVYASAFSGVQVFSPGGHFLGEIRLPGAVNFTFGGPHRNVLFITTDTAVWAAVLNAQGA